MSIPAASPPLAPAPRPTPAVEPVAQLDESGKKMAFVFQSPTLMPWASVQTNVRLPLDLAGVPRAEADTRVTEALALFRIDAPYPRTADFMVSPEFSRYAKLLQDSLLRASVDTEETTTPKRPPLMAQPRVQRVVYPVLVGLVLIALWQGLVTAMELPPYLVPSPILMMKTLFTDWAALGGSLWVTVKITVLAFVVATVAGVLISFLFVQSKRIETALFPYAVLLQVTPIVAVAPLIIIWVKDPTASMVICAALVALFPIISNTTLGLRSVEPDLQSYFQLNRATRLQTLLRLRIPSALPYFFGGLRISSGLALIGAVVAEFVAGTGGQGAGLAYQILQAGFQLNIPRMFAALLLISLTGVALFVLMAWLTRVALGGWHASETSHD
eukprot:gene5151-5202_t